MAKSAKGTYRKSAASSRLSERGMQPARVQYRPAPRSSTSQIQPPSSSAAKREAR